MKNNNKIGIGIIGVGNMGLNHLKNVLAMDNAQLITIYDNNIDRSNEISNRYNIKLSKSLIELLDNTDVQAIIIATPHYSHPEIAVKAFERGIHVLIEKPVGVHVNDVKKINAAYYAAKTNNNDLVFTAMFQQRTYGYWKKIKELLENNTLGKLFRTTWIITTWFRTQYYYDLSGWRATWAGEGGGVLLNQCPHNLDLYQWFVGLPDKITGFMALGKYHNIEVEDDVTAYFEYKNGMVGHFITTTAELPGSNFLEIVGENGKLIYNEDGLVFYKNKESVYSVIKNSNEAFYKENFQGEQHEKIHLKYEHHGELGHRFIIENFINAILKKEKILVDGTEGINSVMISNAIMLSAFNNKTVDIPINGDEFENKLETLKKNSVFKKEVKKQKFAKI